MPVAQDELSKREGLAVLRARQAFGETIRHSVPEPDQLAITCVAAAGLFVNVAGAAFHVARPELVAALNERLGELGLKLVEVPRN